MISGLAVSKDDPASVFLVDFASDAVLLSASCDVEDHRTEYTGQLFDGSASGCRRTKMTSCPELIWQTESRHFFFILSANRRRRFLILQ